MSVARVWGTTSHNLFFTLIPLRDVFHMQLSSSAVARSWGVKLQTYLSSAPVDDSGINLFGGLLETFCVAVFYGGVSIGSSRSRSISLTKCTMF